MKKNLYSLSGALTAISKRCSPLGILENLSLRHYYSRTAHSYPSYRRNTSHISEQPSNFSIKLDKEDRERYLNSFLKKKIISIWKQQRPLVKAAPTLPELLETTVYRDVCQKLKPLISMSYAEDFDLPLMPFTLLGWLQYSKITAQIVGKQMDAVYWDELTNFIHQCSKKELLHDLYSE
ncbi:hypothetical protein [Lihuaxuella thermophila]|uniref:Uncharacterized protein n=1 Tax=Lihuaxuella thermophila TaxID=1173111 RepID=A0A1H8ISY9_9BACL|nr:hypothetical protein [Lihuaxuella thermophila]SEN71255.1 hypothetical protein SAMN05444955_11921 [Lihuaxuella thermophila]